jgi:hypothetical protein
MKGEAQPSVLSPVIILEKPGSFDLYERRGDRHKSK